jgi:flagellar basal-body rod protein FlgB
MIQNQLFFNQTFQTLEKAIDISQKRQGVIAGNISNLDTPGYKAREIDFKAALKTAMDGDTGSTALSRTDARHFTDVSGPGGDVQVHEDPGAFDGLNWVGVDSEMKKLMENKLVYQTAVEAMMRKITIIKDTIREGGR